jgi:hypothetical protein
MDSPDPIEGNGQDGGLVTVDGREGQRLNNSERTAPSARVATSTVISVGGGHPRAGSTLLP